MQTAARYHSEFSKERAEAFRKTLLLSLVFGTLLLTGLISI